MSTSVYRRNDETSLLLLMCRRRNSASLQCRLTTHVSNNKGSKYDSTPTHATSDRGDKMEEMETCDPTSSDRSTLLINSSPSSTSVHWNAHMHIRHLLYATSLECLLTPPSSMVMPPPFSMATPPRTTSTMLSLVSVMRKRHMGT